MNSRFPSEYERQKTIIDIAVYMIVSRCTIRYAAKQFGLSKSTIHEYMTQLLPKLNQNLSQQVRKLLDDNKSMGHLRGGQSTRRKIYPTE